MTGIDGATSRLAGLLAQQLALQHKQRGVRAETRADAPADPRLGERGHPAPSVASADEQQRLLQALTQAVRHLSPQDPERQRKAYRLFMQTVLARTLGRSRFDDMSFTRLLDSVLEQMENDPQLNDQLQQAGQLLLAAADAGSASP